MVKVLRSCYEHRKGRPKPDALEIRPTLVRQTTLVMGRRPRRPTFDVWSYAAPRDKARWLTSAISVRSSCPAISRPLLQILDFSSHYPLIPLQLLAVPLTSHPYTAPPGSPPQVHPLHTAPAWSHLATAPRSVPPSRTPRLRRARLQTPCAANAR